LNSPPATASPHRSIARKLAGYIRRALERVLAVVLYLARVRFLQTTALGRIGHLVIEPELFIRKRALGLRHWHFGVLVCLPGVAANDCLVDYWRRYFWVVRSPRLERLIAPFYRFPYLFYDVSRYTVAINTTAPYIAVQRAWGKRAALLSLDEAHRREGRARLAELGVPPDAEIVCFHCREEGYSPEDDALHAYRNSAVENLFLAITELTRQGYWCIRMGDPAMRRLPPMPQVVDYAHHPARSDRMDVFLCASCRFFLGNSSGLVHLASVFGRPAAAANAAPISTILAYGAGNVAIPKLLWSEDEGRYLGFGETLGSDIGNFRFTELYQARRIRNVENSAEDIRDLSAEMLERSTGTARYSAEDEALQRRFVALMRPGHFSYGGVSRVGRDFLRKYEHLLGD
jgi:putative glycosyltransferase (TIGR04372 family)